MSRGLSSTYVTSSAPVVNTFLAAYCDFSGSAPLRLWTGATSKSLSDDFGGGEYLGVGGIGGISGISEAEDSSAKGLTLQLSGVPSEYVSLALTNPYRGRTVAVYEVFFDDTLTTSEQVCLFRGRMDTMTIEDSQTTSTIKLQCESRFIDFNRNFDDRYTDESQRAKYPNDFSLQWVAGIADLSIYWGSSAPVSTGNAPTTSTPGISDPAPL